MPQDYGQATAVDPRPSLDLITGVVQPPRVEQPRAGVFDVVAAAFRSENTLLSSMNAMGDIIGLGSEARPVEGYTAWPEVKGTPYEQYWDRIAASQSPAETRSILARIDQEMNDDRTLAAAGIGGFVANIAASVVDPTVLIPGVGGYRLGATAGRAAIVARGAAGAAAGGFIGTTAQEAGLQASQLTRTAEESLINIGAGTVLSGLLGGGLAAILTRPQRAAAVEAVNTLSAAGRGQPISAGAAAVDRATLADLTPSAAAGFGEAAGATARATQIVSPNLQLQFSPSTRAREVAQRVTESHLYQGMNDAGRSLGAAAETQARVMYRSRMSTARRETTALFEEAKKAAEFGMTRSQFEEAVGRALRRGDIGENDFVTRGAQIWRKSVLEPFRSDLQELGLLTDDQVNAIVDKSYLPRQYNRRRMVAEQQRFKQIVTAHYERKLATEYQAANEALMKRLAAAEKRLRDIRLTPEERVQALKELEGEGERFIAANAEQAERVNTINDLQRRKREATEARDAQLVEALQKQIEAEQAAGGEQLKDFLRGRRNLRQRRKDVDMNFAGLDARHQKIMQSLVDLEEANFASLNRLIERGRKLERELQKLDPEDAARKISDLRAAFVQIAEKADKALERTAERLRKMDEADAKALAAGEAPDAIKAARDKAQRETIERELAAQEKRAKRMSSISRRLEFAEEFDIDATVAELRASVDDLVREVSDLTLARGEKAQRLKTKMEALDPSVLEAKVKVIEARKAQAQRAFDDKWRVSLDEDGVGFRNASRQIADEVYAKITGTDYGSSLSFADFNVPLTKGPMKDRLLDISDLEIEDFLESNAVDVLERYARTVSSDIALARNFGRADMRDQIAEITDDYARLSADVSNGNKAEALATYRNSVGNPKAEIEDAKLLTWLDKQRARDIENVEALRDILRGSYMRKANAGVGGKLSRGVMTYNYIRAMGGVLISSLGELYRPAMVHGNRNFLSQVVAPMLTDFDNFKLSVEDAKLMGLASEMHLQDRMMTMAELGDPFVEGTPIERLLANAARAASNWNGINLITDFTQSMAATVSQNRILTAAIKGDDTRFLAYTGIDGDVAARIAQQFKAHGKTSGALKIANTQAWTDEVALRAYQAAVTKDVDSIVVRKGIGDVPLLANHPAGRMLIQFRTHALSSHQRVLLRGMQESKTRFASGMVAMTGIGMFIAALGAWRGGSAAWERFKQKSEDNPGYLIAEGVDRSGIFALGVELGNVTETVSRSALGGAGFNPVKSPFLMAGALASPGASAAPASGRTFDRGWLGAVSGPTGGLIERDLPAAARTAGGLLRGEQPSESDMRRAAATVPFGSYLGMKEVLQALQGDSPYAPADQ